MFCEAAAKPPPHKTPFFPSSRAREWNTIGLPSNVELPLIFNQQELYPRWGRMTNEVDKKCTLS